MIERTIQSFSSFADADEADRKERWGMTPDALLVALETLRACKYIDGKTAPQIERVLESVELP